MTKGANYAFLAIIFVLPMLQACSVNHLSVRAYRETIKTIEKKHNLKRADIIVSYDLAKMDNSSTIYAQPLGLIANDSDYAKKYVTRFQTQYRSERILEQEASKKIQKMSQLLVKLQTKYHFLASKKENYVKSLALKGSTYRYARNELSNLDELASRIPLMLPMYKAYLSSSYGKRRHPIKKKYLFHTGTDLVSRKSSPIYASGHGRVVFIGPKNGYGLTVEIDHGNALTSRYTHLAKIYAKKGHQVVRGEAIGLQGKTGHTVGEHLHFEVRLAGKHLNPYDFIGHNYEYFKR